MTSGSGFNSNQHEYTTWDCVAFKPLKFFSLLFNALVVVKVDVDIAGPSKPGVQGLQSILHILTFWQEKKQNPFKRPFITCPPPPDFQNFLWPCINSIQTAEEYVISNQWGTKYEKNDAPKARLYCNTSGWYLHNSTRWLEYPWHWNLVHLSTYRVVKGVLD